MVVVTGYVIIVCVDIRTSYDIPWLQIGRDGHLDEHLDQSEAYDISERVREYGPR